MASATDDTWERLIADFRPRLREYIAVEQVVDHLHHITAEQREQIRLRARTRGDRAAADLLLDAVVRRPHDAGWFRDFVDALSNAGCDYAADYMRDNRPEPAVEAENDRCVQLIHLLSPSLVEMQTEEVCLHCVSEGLITQDDCEIIKAETAQRGSRSGARELLKSIVRGRPGWYSKFLQILRRTEHQALYELTGGSPDCDAQDEKDASPKDEPTGSEAATDRKPEADKTCDTVELMDTSEHMDTQDDATDLYNGENTESEQMQISQEPSQPEGPDPAARGPQNTEIQLRDYQMDVAKPALEGQNIIICLPTGSGKTRVAVYITKNHLDRRRAEGRSGKVVVLVNKVPLVEQHYSKEFLPFLKPAYRVERVSGDSQLKISFTETVKRNDVIICTAQILENYLERFKDGEDEGVNLSDLTLMVIDECHHAQKGDVYNHIMMRYLKQKHRNRRLKKEQKETLPLPQILGLTASPGVGGATKIAKAEEHILVLSVSQICANLDASRIMTCNTGQYKKDPRKKTITIEDRQEDPFGDVIMKIMNAIHAHANLSPTFDLGSQCYEQWIVDKEQKAARGEDHKVRVCAEHLRQYSEGLNLSNTIRMCDAFSFLNEYHEKEIKRKTSPDQEHSIQITDTERFLFNLFEENKRELQTLAQNPQYENDSLSKLRSNILQEFSSREAARGIIFTKTRRSAIALNQWVQENSKFADIDVKSSYIIGGGDQSVVKPMTSAEQKAVLKKFHNGDVNLLIATTVGEEGLDIPACNFVIRYGLVTNEISMIQAEGRGRAEDSSYTVVEVRNSGVAEKECVNEYRRDMMNKAIDKIRALSQAEYENRLTEYQFQAVTEERVRKKKMQQKDLKNAKPSEVSFSCHGCSKHVCTGEDIQIIERMHRVNVTPEFSQLYIQRENTSLQERFLDYETNGFIACKDCGQRWGAMMMYRGIECPCLHVKNFVVTLGGKKLAKCTKWSELAVDFSAFDYTEHASRMAESSEEEDAD